MAASASPTEVSSARIPAGVAPIRAGQGNEFLLRRLHSLSGIFPIGAFIAEHFLSNSLAVNGANAYNENVKFLTSLPFVLGLEIVFIYIPILYHAGYGFFIWWRGETNVRDYPWVGNWMYTLQRWTGIIAIVYIVYHTWTMRFTGAHIMTHSDLAFAKVWSELQNPWLAVFYVLGMLSASWHFAYGIWLFCAKWGITVGERARKRLGYVCVAIGLLLAVMAGGSLYAFVTTSEQDVPHLQEFRQMQQTAANYTK